MRLSMNGGSTIAFSALTSSQPATPTWNEPWFDYAPLRPLRPWTIGWRSRGSWRPALDVLRPCGFGAVPRHIGPHPRVLRSAANKETLSFEERVRKPRNSLPRRSGQRRRPRSAPSLRKPLPTRPPRPGGNAWPRPIRRRNRRAPRKLGKQSHRIPSTECSARDPLISLRPRPRPSATITGFRPNPRLTGASPGAIELLSCFPLTDLSSLL